MVKDSKFWVGVLVGVILFYVYQHYMTKKTG